MIREKYIMSVVTVALVLTACGSKSKGDTGGLQATVVVQSNFEPKWEAGATSGSKITIANINEKLITATWDESVMVTGPDGTRTAAPRYNAEIMLNAVHEAIAVECYEPIY